MPQPLSLDAALDVPLWKDLLEAECSGGSSIASGIQELSYPTG